MGDDWRTFVGKVLLSELVFLNFKPSLEEFLSLVASDGDVDCHLFVSLDTERSDGVSGLGFNWLLISEIFEHLSGLGESISTLSDTAVQDELFNSDVSHLVFELFLLLCDYFHHVDILFLGLT